ncbi:hypothetical protein K9N68_04595 [Kovacikia minuta CCNUW1]|uniref:hypothetical protein n=1 Tax=Kovacikia minuta TaxID=2931930 RepID=UPI001CCE67FA|nr:hypothetical protein [Kovacikia minuta]UBF27249.1 hypothetical protein K9N68_04595 [Kovacikia minuta CCNUW1]
MIATTSQSDTYQSIMEAAYRVNWRVDDLIGNGKRLDFNQPMMPDSLAGVNGIECLNNREKLILNQIRGNSYLHLFGVVEEFIVPLVLDHVRRAGHEDIYATQAFLCFAEEESKHIHLFRRFAEEFDLGFGTPCGCIGPAQAIADAVLQHSPLGVALAVLQIEWMSQQHYLDSIQNNQDLDPQFCSLLRHHWLEEAQHARLDTLMVESLVNALDAEGIQKGIEDYFAIGSFLESGLMNQVQLDIESLEKATGRTFSDAEKQQIQAVQEKSYRWTFLGSGMTHPNFIKTLREISPAAVDRVTEMVNAMRA